MGDRKVTSDEALPNHPSLVARHLMTIHVKLYAGLRRYKPEVPLGASFACTLPNELTVARLFDELGLPPQIVAIALVNGIARDREHVLCEGDKVALWPPIAGG